jgi:hypothetical protein
MVAGANSCNGQNGQMVVIISSEAPVREQRDDEEGE